MRDKAEAGSAEEHPARNNSVSDELFVMGLVGKTAKPFLMNSFELFIPKKT